MNDPEFKKSRKWNKDPQRQENRLSWQVVLPEISAEYNLTPVGMFACETLRESEGASKPDIDSTGITTVKA